MARPIDADGFLDRNAEFANREFIHPKYQTTLRELIESAPTLSPDEVRGVGEWIWNDDVYHCSECGFHAHGSTLEILTDKFHYCPSCGARMKGADDGTTDTI